MFPVAGDLTQLGLAPQPDAAAATGVQLIAAVVLLAAVTVVLHIVATLLWCTLPRSRGHPLPQLLINPVPEILMGSVLVLPLALASALPLAAPGRTAGNMALGAAGLLALSCYLGLVGVALLGLARSGHSRWAAAGTCWLLLCVQLSCSSGRPFCARRLPW